MTGVSTEVATQSFDAVETIFQYSQMARPTRRLGPGFGSAGAVSSRLVTARSCEFVRPWR